MPKYVVRHGVMRQLGVFSARARDRYARGQRVIARTSRGLELGEVLCEATEHSLAQMDDPKSGQILRLESADDHLETQKLREQRDRELEVCREKIAEIGLTMDLVDVERLYGGERVIVYYLAEGRVDFRELVKVLAREFQTRVEMRQIGVRDEAKLLADYGDCGMPVCCNTHLSQMPPVSMKMAKLQKASLDPTKISGRCGRLKCCLRYEYESYRSLQKDLPRVGTEIITGNGRAKVLAQEILSGQLLIETEDARRVTIGADEVLSVLGRREPEGGPDRGDAPGVAPTGGGAPGDQRPRRGGRGGRSSSANPKPSTPNRPSEKASRDPTSGGEAASGLGDQAASGRSSVDPSPADTPLATPPPAEPPPSSGEPSSGPPDANRNANDPQNGPGD